MRNRYLLIAASALFLGACSSSSDNAGDGGGTGGTTGGDAPVDMGRTYYLTTGSYVILSASDVTDGCKIGVDKQNDPTTGAGLIGATFPITVDNNTGDVTWGNMQGDPAVPSLGKGNIQANKGTLTMMTKITVADSMCTLDRMVTSDITMTGDYTFTAKITRTDSNRMMCDTADVMGATCTSTFTWMVTKAAATDGGTGG